MTGRAPRSGPRIAAAALLVLALVGAFLFGIRQDLAGGARDLGHFMASFLHPQPAPRHHLTPAQRARAAGLTPVRDATGPVHLRQFPEAPRRPGGRPPPESQAPP